MEDSTNHYAQRRRTRTRSSTQPEIVRHYKEMFEYAKAIHRDWDDINLSTLALELMKLEKE